MPTRSPSAAVALSVALVIGGAAPAARSEPGLAALDGVVREACACAGGHRSGLNAALACTDGPRQFGRVKVAHRDGWSERERAQAEELERIIEACLTHALDFDDARTRLGLPRRHHTGRAPLYTWERVELDALDDHPARLVRVDRGDGAPLKGMVDGVRDGTLHLRRASMDGGGVERIPLDSIRGVWVMELP